MSDNINFSEKLNNKIQGIKKQILMGELILLDLELKPIFEEIKENIRVDNLNHSTNTYKFAYELLDHKFNELKSLLKSLGNDQMFLNYLKSEPEDLEINQLFDGCWNEVFTLDSLSINFLERSKELLLKFNKKTIEIYHLEKLASEENFLIEIPGQTFSENLKKFLEDISPKLPCKFEEIFENYDDQIQIYKNFVLTLHLLQSGKLQYQKETNFLYRDDKK